MSGSTKENQMKGNSNKLQDGDLENTKAHILVEIIEYVPNAVLIKTIIKRLLEMLVPCLLIAMKA